MIVMKFGGSSLATARAIQRVTRTVQSQVLRRPIIVVSAIASTTNQLAAVLKAAQRGDSYGALKLHGELSQHHFCVAEDLLTGGALQRTDKFLRDTFRNLHQLMLQIAEDGQEVTPQLTSDVLSLGERLSSYIVAETLSVTGLAATHVDARKLILTDSQFTQAAPKYWETYANIRWTLPLLTNKQIPVLGGFIGADQNGKTTILGRGGSDLTASIVGAAVNAEEIQIWTDVDGMLTMDPRVRAGGYRIKDLTYDEATELARGGAKVLHPDTIAPAQRLRIPVVIKNSFLPGTPGTRISVRAVPSSNPIKSIAVKPNVTLLAIRALEADGHVFNLCKQLLNICHAHSLPGEAVAADGDTLYFSIDGDAAYEQIDFKIDSCVSVRVHSKHALLTLVGDALRFDRRLFSQIAALLSETSALLLPQRTDSCSLKVAVPEQDVSRVLDMIEQTFFRTIDLRAFAIVAKRDPDAGNTSNEKRPVSMPRTGQEFVPSILSPRLALRNG